MQEKLGPEAPKIDFEFLTSQDYFPKLIYKQGPKATKDEPKFWDGYKGKKLSGHDLIDLLRANKIRVRSLAPGDAYPSKSEPIINTKLCPNL